MVLLEVFQAVAVSRDVDQVVVVVLEVLLETWNVVKVVALVFQLVDVDLLVDQVVV